MTLWKKCGFIAGRKSVSMHPFDKCFGSGFGIHRLCELTDMHRIKDPDHLSSSDDLVSSKGNIGDWTAVQGLTPRNSLYSRYLLIIIITSLFNQM